MARAASGFLEQSHMTRVKRAHRWNQRELPLAAQSGERTCQFFTRANGLHGWVASVTLLTGRRFGAAGEKIKP
jgi:hypothetical protein